MAPAPPEYHSADPSTIRERVYKSSLYKQHGCVEDVSAMRLVRAKGLFRPHLTGIDRALQRLDLCDEAALRDLKAWFISELELLFLDAHTDLFS